LSPPAKALKTPRHIGHLTFRPNDAVMVTGIYRVTHHQHRLPAEVTLIHGHIFPGCSKCTGSVRFEFLRPVKPSRDFQINLFTLPELQDDNQNALPDTEAA
jgi:hypothetical protein